MALAKYQMQGKSLGDDDVPAGTLFSWLSDLPDWTGAFATVGGELILVTDVALAGGGFDIPSSTPTTPDGAMTFDDGSLVVFDDGSYVTTT
jgi:hypothetical protein